jgi:TPP-dependent pyruvate/acetoin dehydrogenase alpha subunit
MFGDPFGVDNETFEKVTVDLSVSLATIISILIEKKIVTEEEYEEYRKACEELINKSVNDTKEQKKKEFEEQYPKLFKAFGL